MPASPHAALGREGKTGAQTHLEDEVPARQAAPRGVGGGRRAEVDPQSETLHGGGARLPPSPLRNGEGENAPWRGAPTAAGGRSPSLGKAWR